MPADLKMEWRSRNVFLFLYIFFASTSLHDAMNISTRPGGPGVDYSSPTFAQPQALGGLPSSAVNPSVLLPQQAYVSPVPYGQPGLRYNATESSMMSYSHLDSSQYPISDASMNYTPQYSSQMFDQSSNNVPMAYPVRNYPHDPPMGANYTKGDSKVIKKMKKREEKEIKEREKLIKKEEKRMYTVPKEKGHNNNKDKKKHYDVY